MQTMEVALDVSPVTLAADRRTGLARSSLCLTQALLAEKDLRLTLVGSGSVAAGIEVECVHAAEGWKARLAARSLPIDIEFSAGRLSQGAIGKWMSRLYNLVREPYRDCRSIRFNVVHSTYARLSRRLRRQGVPTVLTVHDLIPLVLEPKYFPSSQLGVTRRILRSVRPYDWVICPSETSRRDLLLATNLPEDRCAVIPWGLDHAVLFADPAAVERLPEDLQQRRYLMTLSSLAPHKNIDFLVKCFAIACEGKRGSDHLLVIVGANGPAVQERLLVGIRDSLRSRIRFTGYLDDATIRALYSSAECFLFPSLYEGFGFPALEAMACGAPVICSSGGALSEVQGLYPGGLSPTDTASWVEAIRQVFDCQRCGPSVASLNVASQFDWAETARRHVAFYRHVAGASS